MAGHPRISVLMPTFNHGPWIERAICSVLDQGYDDLELIIIDCGSDDETGTILDLYEDPVSDVIRAPGLTRTAALNRGLKRATGMIVGVIDGDGLYLPGTLDLVAATMTDREQSVDGSSIQLPPRWVVGQCIRIGERDQWAGATLPSVPPSLGAYLMHNAGVLPGASSFYRRELFGLHGQFDERMTLAADYELNCRLMVNGEKPTLVPQLVVAEREHSARHGIETTIARGEQYIEAARLHGEKLPISERYRLWVNCDRRQRIYALARAESEGDHARAAIWHGLLRHPWWIADDSVRRMLRQPQPAPAAARRVPTPKAA